MLDKKHILKKRAEKLAKIDETQDQIKDFIEFLVFKLAKEQYAIENKYIKEVYPYKDYTILPSAPDFIFGLINVRRKILSIVDLKVFFSLQSEEVPDHKVIIVEDGDMEFAILTDGLQGIQKIHVDSIQPSLPTFSGIKQDFLKGVTLDNIVIIDGKKLIASKLLIVDESVEIER